MMEEHLHKLVEYATPKPKSLICIDIEDVVHTTTRVSFSHSYEIALTSLETYYSFPNINKSNNHIKISFGDGEESLLDIHIPVGCYEITAINNELQRRIMQKIGDKKPEERIILSSNPNTLRCVLEVIDKNYRADFDVGDDSLCTVLGFDRKV